VRGEIWLTQQGFQCCGLEPALALAAMARERGKLWASRAGGWIAQDRQGEQAGTPIAARSSLLSGRSSH